MNYQDLDTPALLIDREILLNNLKRMQDYADDYHISLRPHTKTHKMPYIAQCQLDLGSNGIAVAKVGEAEVMAAHGVKDIFIANEIVGRSKLERIIRLMEQTNISFGIDSCFQVHEIEQVFSKSGKVAEVLIEVEVGEKRCGINTEEECLYLLESIKQSPHVSLKGFFGHDGNTYQAKNREECFELSKVAQEKLVYFSEFARSKGMDIPIVSYGSTPPLNMHVEIIDGITELRPGTYALMDASQGFAIGTLEQCAATVLSTVISKLADGRVILDVGAKGITMQERKEGICCSFGKGLIWGYPNVSIERIFDEHAIIHNASFWHQVEIGQKVRVIPVHICPTCNLYDKASLISGQNVVHELSVSARGKLQ